MKRLILSTAILLGGLTAVTAQTEKEATAMAEPQQNVAVAQVESKLAAAQDSPMLATTVQDYKEVKVSEVPKAVEDAVSKEFNGATISKAYVNAQGEYKLQLATADQKTATVYSDAKGQLSKNELKKQ